MTPRQRIRLTHARSQLTQAARMTVDANRTIAAVLREIEKQQQTPCRPVLVPEAVTERQVG